MIGVVLWLAGFAQSPSALQAAQEKPNAEALVEDLITLIEENYVLEDRVPAIVTELRTNLGSGEYQSLATPTELGMRLTEDLRGISGDLHFGIRPKPAPYSAAAPQKGSGSKGSADPAKHQPGPAARIPKGIRTVSILEGNVGYLELARFLDPKVGGPEADAAFLELAGTDALILDVRNSRGGHPGMVAHLLSYFFEGEPFLFNRLSWRNSGKTIEFRTLGELPSPRYTQRQVFVLTSQQTPSAAEGFSYHMKHFDRATVVGEATAGAAHLTQMFELGKYQVAVPTGRPTSLATGGNWEGAGVQPDEAVAAEDALEVAHRRALDGLR